MRVIALVAAVLAVAATSARLGAGVRLQGSPVRRIITMLQMMQRKVEEEGEKEGQLFDKFMCMCSQDEASLQAAVAAGNEKVPQLESSIEELSATIGQLESELVEHKSDREKAMTALQEAESIRTKEHAEFQAEYAETTANVNALKTAIKALSVGSDDGAALVQEDMVRIQAMIQRLPSYRSYDREALTAFVQGRVAAQDIGEIRGILSHMLDDMQVDAKHALEEEESAKAQYDQLVSSKGREVATTTKMIEDKAGRHGDARVSLSDIQRDYEDTKSSVEKDEALLAKVREDCQARKTSYEKIKKERVAELSALADTVKILNDDESRELFSRTVPTQGLFLQVGASSRQRSPQAVLFGLQQLSAGNPQQPGLALVNSAARVVAHGRAKPGFEKVMAMIDGMVEILSREQGDDESKKEMCVTETERESAKMEDFKQTLKGLSADEDTTEDQIDTARDDIAILQKAIAQLDSAVAEATQRRKEEHAASVEELASNNAAVELLEIAKNRLDKFYNPKLYKAPAPQEPASEADRIAQNFGVTTPAPLQAMQPEDPGHMSWVAFTQLRSSSSSEEDNNEMDIEAEQLGLVNAQPKAREEASGVIEMINMLKVDLEKEIQDIESADVQR